MDKRYYQAKNGYGEPAKYNNKNIYYYRTKYLGSVNNNSMSEKEMSSKIKDKNFIKGWLECENFYVVNDLGRESKLFKSICQIG